jgi:hypothetical protein
VTRRPLYIVAESRAPFLSQAQGFDLTFQQVFILIRCLRVFIGFNFVIESAGFDSPLIHLTSVISRYSYT